MTNMNLGVAFVLLVLYFAGSITAVDKDATPVVTLKHGGKLQGSTLTTIGGRNFYAFRGIPYAEPPVGDLRFKAPEPKSPWSDVVDATKDGSECVQMDFTKNQPAGEEDCLKINVYTRELPGVDKDANDKSAVMVFLHGGGFTVGDGSSSTYSPRLLMDVDVVFVALNYRLNAFGFMSTDDEAAPGNYGMLDQNMALKWVQENIETFGGDPNRVLLFGESAGSASVSHHLLSPLSKGLFHNAIMQSGTSTCPWAVNLNASYWSNRLGNDLGCPTDNSQELVDCLRKAPAEDILKYANSYKKVSYFPIPFTPSVDGHFLPEHPLKLLREGKVNKVPVISGICQLEGAFFMTHISLDYPYSTLTQPEVQKTIVDNILANPQPCDQVTQLIQKAYFDPIDGNNETQVEGTIVHFISDGMFDSCHFQTIKLLTEAGLRTYAYEFEYWASTNNTFQKVVLGIPGSKWGVGHQDDLLMFFPFPGSVFNGTDGDMSKKMIKVWTDFAKTGTPVAEDDESLPQWPQITEDVLPVYHFNEPITVKPFDKKANHEKYHFWTHDVRKAREDNQNCNY